MAAMAGLLNHSLTAEQALRRTQANPMAAPAEATDATTGGDDSGSSDGSSTISANDFLTLLVTEMQNQDPTADTDPNEYINQLVQVNSLEQLISINQNLSTVLGTSNGSSGTGSSSGHAGSGQAGSGPSATSASNKTPVGLTPSPAPGVPSHTAQAASAGASNTAMAINRFAQVASGKHAPGNLSIPAADPAAHRVAHALDGRSRSRTTQGRLPAAQ